MTGKALHLPPGEGPNYDWENDHTFVIYHDNTLFAGFEYDLKCIFTVLWHVSS